VEELIQHKHMFKYSLSSDATNSPKLSGAVIINQEDNATFACPGFAWD